MGLPLSGTTHSIGRNPDRASRLTVQCHCKRQSDALRSIIDVGLRVPQIDRVSEYRRGSRERSYRDRRLYRDSACRGFRCSGRLELCDLGSCVGCESDHTPQPQIRPSSKRLSKHALSVTKLAVSVWVVVSVTKSSVLVTVVGSAVLVETWMRKVNILLRSKAAA